jgi:hypothetical protein
MNPPKRNFGGMNSSSMTSALVPEPQKDAGWDRTRFFDAEDDEDDARRWHVIQGLIYELRCD